MDDIRIVVRQVVETYLKKRWKPSVAVLLSYQSSNQSDILKAVAPIVDSYKVTLILSKEWQSAASQLGASAHILLEEASQQEVAEVVEKTTALVIPSGSYELLTKLALTIDDRPAVKLAIHYQLQGKPIVIAKDGIELNVYQQILAPPSMQDRLQSYIRQIQADQVKWVSLAKLSEAVADQVAACQEKQSLILAKHIDVAFRDGLQEITVPKNNKVTPSARDRAKELKIRISRTQKEGRHDYL